MERKLATVLFVDLVDSTMLVADADPEVVRRRVSSFFDQVSRCIVTHGGTVEKFAGDAVMAAFGVPLAHEDDAERAVRAGLATLEKRHVQLLGDDRLIFVYVGKSGQHRLQGIVDPLVYETAAELKRRRAGGTAFLAYRERRWVDLRSSDINAFIKELAGPEFSAKDFRTWHATVLAAVGLGGFALPRPVYRDDVRDAVARRS